ncbi:imidazoleglycerol-phosphate dehydratase HisB [Woodsholea maritima]|uniref:imidazoleglycerol-phosphate dehydratase HisB n=1 Tax=Woodsholea maritima TaxID=240237 RepID=UPI00037E5D8B|nr:imidazoleglycerol-phosphate dehydratase HisB [Woodsholea maritima]
MDLSQSFDDQRQAWIAQIKARLGALTGHDEGKIYVYDSARAAYQAAGAMPWMIYDYTDQGVEALKRAPSERNYPALLALGTPEAPVCVMLAPEKLDSRELLPAAIVLKQLQDRLSPAGLKTAYDEALEKHAMMTPLAGFFEAQAGAISVKIHQNGLTIRPKNVPDFQNKIKHLGLTLCEDENGFTAFIPDVVTAKALAAYLGLNGTHRRAQIRRKTKETDIALSLDLDGSGTRIETGLEFFDHMLDQIARHGGFALDVVCEGDLGVDAHHTIEDVCLTLGEALREALGDKRGIGRFGFALPMDETRASVWIDVSGRPFIKFDGDIPGERVGDFPVEMTAHAFRSLSESLKASIHVEVQGENAHHMIEGCFKAFGRALRQAIRIEGSDLPSTKGVL